MDELSSRQVTLHDSFWSPRLEVNARRAIFHQWEQLESSGCIDNFRIAAGEKEGFRIGWFFADSDAYKWLDAAARISVGYPDDRLAALMDGLIALLGRAQSPDGYLFTYNQIHFPITRPTPGPSLQGRDLGLGLTPANVPSQQGNKCMRWVNLQIEHELYCHGHLIEAGVSHHQATGRNEMLDIARKAANLLVRDFLGAGPEHTPGHEEVEIALLRLYHLTGHAPYLELARQFIERRGRTPLFAISLLRQYNSVAMRKRVIEQQRLDFSASHPGWALPQLPPGNYAKLLPFGKLRWYANALSGKYFQQHAPVREQVIPVGHAVRFGYLETAVAKLHRLQDDETLLPALEKTWERMVTRRMYVTGGVGALPALEGFGRDYELDPEYAYTETCAALASMFWSWEMALITRQAKYSDLFEWQLYNAAAPGMGLSGQDYLYNNPLACRQGVRRKAWYAVPCCPSNLSRTWADLGKYIYSYERDEIWIHQYLGSRTRLDLGVPCEIEIESELPWEGRVRIKVSPEKPQEFTLNLRLPSWSASSDILLRQGNTDPVQIMVGLKNSQTADAQSGANCQFAQLGQANSSPYFGEPTAQGYDPRQSRFLPIRRTWSPGDRLELDFDLPLTLRRAHPKVKKHASKVAVTRGPLVYCLESVDNPGVDIFSARLDRASLQAEPAPNLLGGITVVRGHTTSGTPLTFIPYHLWANRGESQIVVWVNL